MSKKDINLHGVIRVKKRKRAKKTYEYLRINLKNLDKEMKEILKDLNDVDVGLTLQSHRTAKSTKKAKPPES